MPSHKAHGAVYIVLDDFGKLGRVYRETDETAADAETVIRDLLRGEYHRPVRVIAFNTDEGWSIDASREVAAAVVDIATGAATGLRGRPLSNEELKAPRTEIDEIDPEIREIITERWPHLLAEAGEDARAARAPS